MTYLEGHLPRTGVEDLVKVVGGRNWSIFGGSKDVCRTESIDEGSCHNCNERMHLVDLLIFGVMRDTVSKPIGCVLAANLDIWKMSITSANVHG